jgi:dihydrolipoamide dehydrogenase
MDVKSERILGVQIVGPDASDLISEMAVAIEMGATAHDIALTIHPHPTLPEAIMEAAEAALGKAIHIVNRK